MSVLFDTDPGADDALALLWLASLTLQNRCQILAVTTVEGNVDRKKTYQNACRLLDTVGLSHIRVAAGGYHKGGREYASHVHGEDGLGGLAELLPPSNIPFEKAPNSVETLINVLGDPGRSTSLLAVGPLTNLATAEQDKPGTLNRAKEIIIMGGAIEQGNVTPYAEFNIHFDPEAANTVFKTAKDVILIPLNVTRKLVFTQAHAARVVAKRHGILASLLTQLTEFMTATARVRGVQDGFFVHDAATVAYLMHPETLTFAQANLTVDLRDAEQNGETKVQFDAPASKLNAWIATHVQADAVLDQLCQDLDFLLS